MNFLPFGFHSSQTFTSGSSRRPPEEKGQILNTLIQFLQLRLSSPEEDEEEKKDLKKYMNTEITLPCGSSHAAVQSNWFPSDVHQLFLLLQVAQALQQSNTEQTHTVPAAAAATSALQCTCLPT